MLRPPSNPRPTAPLPGQRADGAPPPNLRAGALMAERRTVAIHVRVSPAERAAWRAKAAGSPAFVCTAAAGDGPDADLDRTGPRRRARALACEVFVKPSERALGRFASTRCRRRRLSPQKLFAHL